MTSAPMTASATTGWTLPSFYCPIPPADPPVHPLAADLQRRALDWVAASGIVRDQRELAWSAATHSTDFSCRLIPDGDPELILLFILWNHWAFALDDNWHDTGSAAIRTREIVDINTRILRTLEIPGAALLDSREPLTRALEDLAARTREALTPVQLHRVTHGLRDWLWGASWLVGTQERRELPALSDYVAMRPSVNGTRFSLAWSELAAGVALPGELLYDPRVQALTEAAGFIVSCDNDFFSYPKEDSAELLDPNIVNILARDRGCSPQEALQEAAALRDRTMSLYVRLREQVARTAAGELARYLRVLDHYIAGCIHWMNNAPRYASPRNRHPLPVPGASWHISWRDTPSDPDPGPPPVPAAAWWWRHLDT
ncbi:terpene synthase family protein [Streptomyces sp. YIM 98790]|uniref:terpene synthase family protein n=1 Tax=Streptomyces sp. YIM 98790 TaxID=2689077 RepID=UPI001408DF47|nr:terpene synthase family protein [Streptomyces sp. YIM 98790]